LLGVFERFEEEKPEEAFEAEEEEEAEEPPAEEIIRNRISNYISHMAPAEREELKEEVAEALNAITGIAIYSVSLHRSYLAHNCPNFRMKEAENESIAQQK